MTVSSEIQSFRQKFLNLNVVTQIESKEDDKKEQCDHNHCQEEPNLQGWHLSLIPSFILSGIHLVLLGSHYSDCFEPYPGEKNAISEEGEENEANVGKDPNLEGSQAPILVRRVLHHGVEDPDLAEEDGDKEGGPGGVGGGRQEEGEPGGDGEHGGGQEVDQQGLHWLMLQNQPDPCCGVELPLGIPGFFKVLHIAQSDVVVLNFPRVQKGVRWLAAICAEKH